MEGGSPSRVAPRVLEYEVTGLEDMVALTPAAQVPQPLALSRLQGDPAMFATWVRDVFVELGMHLVMALVVFTGSFEFVRVTND